MLDDREQLVGFEVHCLSGDKRTLEYRLWQDWMWQVCALRKRFADWAVKHDYHRADPAYWNETATTSMLASAANMAGFVALAEYYTRKRMKEDLRRKTLGRVDLWLSDMQSGRDWGIEAKQKWVTGRESQARLEAMLEVAARDALCLARSDASRRVGLLVLLPKEHGSDFSNIEAFCASSQHSYRLDVEGWPIWLIFKFID